MAIPAEKLADTAKLYRQSGHCSQSAKLLAVAKTAYPTEECLEREQQRLAQTVNPRFRRCRYTLSWVVDRLGVPMVFVLMALVAYLLAPILFVPSL